MRRDHPIDVHAWTSCIYAVWHLQLAVLLSCLYCHLLYNTGWAYQVAILSIGYFFLALVDYARYTLFFLCIGCAGVVVAAVNCKPVGCAVMLAAVLALGLVMVIYD